ncbi:MAG TPA: class II glutamine amidotransferase [Cyclobacteriaceae bacterium]|nr:class II glutamine amidotransferase [Cyclobacteriaceae bacterium]
MCRLIAYKGSPIVLDKLLYQPKNSLINQSFQAKELEEPLNGDGFGVGWYVPDLHHEPATFVSVFPAWNNKNLKSLAPKIKAQCLFAHVRAASVGDVSESNCHPFQYRNLLMMHNGGVEEFGKIKRKLREPLTDELYQWIKGQTDSEHIFAYLLNHLFRNYNEVNIAAVTDAFENTYSTIKDLMENNGINDPAYLNMALSNGEFIVATRYVSDTKETPLTLYHSEGSRYVCEDGICRMLEPNEREQAVLIVSEKLTDVQRDWKEIPANHFVIVDRDLIVTIKPIN